MTKPATNEQIAEMKADYKGGDSEVELDVRSLIARIEQERATVEELGTKLGKQAERGIAVALALIRDIEAIGSGGAATRKDADVASVVAHQSPNAGEADTCAPGATLSTTTEMSAYLSLPLETRRYGPACPWCGRMLQYGETCPRCSLPTEAEGDKS